MHGCTRDLSGVLTPLPEELVGLRETREVRGTSWVDEARIRLQFTSPTKPALITGSTGNGDEPTPDYRYLVVPLRALAGA